MYIFNQHQPQLVLLVTMVRTVGHTRFTTTDFLNYSFNISQKPEHFHGSECVIHLLSNNE